ncbi:MAG: hypothetical protein LBD45_03495 [Bacteroidales bacterium]|jgi:hypothetical protein|nr:hypothetical protein [Bacteroidales bacterium]
MKKYIFLLNALLLLSSSLTAQISPETADELAYRYIAENIGESQYLYLYANRNVTTETTFATEATGENFSLNHPCWAYCVVSQRNNEYVQQYLFINKVNGAISEMRLKSDALPELSGWDLMEEFTCEWAQLAPATPTDVQKNALDKLFSESSELLKNIAGDTLFVIDDRQGLDMLNPDKNAEVDIDFEKYSLVGGKVFVSSISDHISSTHLSVCATSAASTFKYEVAVDKCTADCLTATGYLYFWEIYPKINAQHIPLVVNTEFQDFNMDVFSCSWQYSKLKADHIYLISSQEELLTIVTCENETSLPAIDFSKYSLLFVYGGTTYGVDKVVKKLQQISSNEYALSVDVKLNMTAFPEGWKLSIVIPKILEESVFKLNKNIHH